MIVLVEPACYVWAAGPNAEVGYPPDVFIGGVVWLSSFFEHNRTFQILMTCEMRDAVSQLFPYSLVRDEGRMAQAQELIAVILRMIERASSEPFHDYSDSQFVGHDLGFFRPDAVYSDDNLWVSWCDAVAFYTGDASQHGEPRVGFVAATNSCIDPAWVGPRGRGPISWLVGNRDPLPRGAVDPGVVETLQERGHGQQRSVGWEDSGHQPPIVIKRLIARVVNDCDGVVLYSMSKYHNPSLAVRCGVSCSSDEHIADLNWCASDGEATVKGVFRTTARNSAEQRTALEYVRQRMAERCFELDLTFGS